MTISTQMNAMNQKPLKGQLAAIFNANTLVVMLDPTSQNTLATGDYVKLVSTTGANIIVDKAAATDNVLGVVIRTPKKQTFAAGDSLEIACDMSVVYLESYGSITRGDNLEYRPTGVTVQTNGGINPVSGVAFDNASGSGELIRVLVRTSPVPVGVAQTVQSLNGAAATVAIDPTKGGVCTIAPTVNATINAASTPAGMGLSLIITSDGNDEILTFGTGFKSAGTLNCGNTNAKMFAMKFVSDGSKFVEESRTTAL